MSPTVGLCQTFLHWQLEQSPLPRKYQSIHRCTKKLSAPSILVAQHSVSRIYLPLGSLQAMKSQLIYITLIFKVIPHISLLRPVITVGINTNGQRNNPQREGVRSIALSRLAGLHHIMEVLDHKLCCCSCLWDLLQSCSYPCF